MRTKNILILLAVLLVLGGVWYIVSRPTQTSSGTPKIYVWNVQDSDLSHIAISLPREGKNAAFVKITNGDKFPWFFDDAQNSPVDTTRWGGGIPLLLSGPGADRVITEDATDEMLHIYGLDNPNMIITLTLTSNEVMKIYVGNYTPNGNNYYVKAPDSNAVATVDNSWYTVLENLVKTPPYVSSVAVTTKITTTETSTTTTDTTETVTTPAAPETTAVTSTTTTAAVP